MEKEFIPFMLAHHASERGVQFGDKRYAAEPKLEGRPVAVFSRPGPNEQRNHIQLKKANADTIAAVISR